jgi:hypothetical protein
MGLLIKLINWGTKQVQIIILRTERRYSIDIKNMKTFLRKIT